MKNVICHGKCKNKSPLVLSYGYNLNIYKNDVVFSFGHNTKFNYRFDEEIDSYYVSKTNFEIRLSSKEFNKHFNIIEK